MVGREYSMFHPLKFENNAIDWLALVMHEFAKKTTFRKLDRRGIDFHTVNNEFNHNFNNHSEIASQSNLTKIAMHGKKFNFRLFLGKKTARDEGINYLCYLYV